MRMPRTLGLLIALVAVAALAPALPASAAVVVDVHYVPSGGELIRLETRRDTALDPQPVLLTMSPYNSNGSNDTTGDSYATRYVPRGIARASSDVLGTRGSTGCYDYGGLAEQQAGVDVVNYLAALPWSNGNVGMIGTSYNGTTANMVAARGPEVPALKAIVPIASISRWYGYAYSQGLRYTVQSANGSPTQQGIDTPLLFDTEYGRGFLQNTNDPHFQRRLIDKTGECGAIAHTQGGYDLDPDYGQFWLDRDYLKDAAKFRAAVFLVHGLQDYNVKMEEGLNLWNALVEDDPATTLVEGPPFKRLWLTQSGHANGSGPGYQDLLDAFLEQTLQGVDRGVHEGPEVMVAGRTTSASGAYVTTEFRAEETWPLPGTTPTALHLGGTAAAGTLSTTPRTDPSAMYADVAAGDEYRTIQTGRLPDGILYLSPPLAADTRMVGEALLNAVITTNRDRGTLTPVLYDVVGTTYRPAARGFLNLQYRDGLAAAKPTPNGAPFGATVILKPQDHTFPAGHRIGLGFMTSNTFWARPDAPGQVTTVHQGVGGLASTLVLPLISPAEQLFATG